MSIKTNIQVNDQFTKPLRDMNNALNMTISHFEKLQEVSSHPVDTDGLRYAREQLGDVDLAINNMQSGIQANTEEQTRFENEVSRTSLSMNSLLRRVVSVSSALLLVRTGFRKMTQGFNTFTEFDGVLGELSGVTEAYGHNLDVLSYKAKTLGQTTLFSHTQVAKGMITLSRGGLDLVSVLDTVDDAVTLATAGSIELDEASSILVDTMRGFNLTADDTGRIIDTITYAANSANTDIGKMGQSFMQTASVAEKFNASIEETASVIAMMSSAAKGGRAGRSLRIGLGNMASPTDNAQNWLDQLNVDFIDPATNDLKGLSTIIDDLSVAFEGLSKVQSISAAKDIFGRQAYAAWLEVLEQGAGEFDKTVQDIVDNAEGGAERIAEIMESTMEGTMAMFRGKIGTIWTEFYESLNEGVAGDGFEVLLDGILWSMQVILTMVEGLLTVLGVLFDFVGNNLGIIIPLLSIILGLLFFKLIPLSMIGTAIGVIALQIWSVIAPFVMWFGVAMMVVAGLYLIIGVVKKVTGITLSATGIIVGGISVGVAVIGNLFIGLLNVIWFVVASGANFFMGFAELISNVFINPVAAAKKSIYSLGIYVGNILSKIAGAIDALFGSNLSGSVNRWVGTLGEKVDDLVEEKGLNDFEGFDYDLGLDFFDLGDAWDSGFKLGEGIQSSIGDMFSYDPVDPGDLIGDFGLDGMDDILNGMDDLGGGLGDLGDQLGDIGGKTGDIAKNTKGGKDDLGMAKEDLKYLRDLASDHAMSRYTSNDVKLEVINNNHISSDMDIDGVVNTMVDGLEEYVNAGMEGV